MVKSTPTLDSLADHNLFHITIGTSSSSTTRLDGDLRLVKAALLYGDQATLCSPSASLLLSLMGTGNLTTKQQMELLEAMLSQLELDGERTKAYEQTFQSYKRLSKKHPTRDELLFKLKLEREIGRFWDSLSSQVRILAEASGAVGILDALNTGILELHPFQSFNRPKDAALGERDHLELIILEFFEVVSNAVADGSTYPLFNDTTGQVINSAIREGKISVPEGGTARGKHIGLAAGLLERLPLFDLATIQEILEIRDQLERPLIRFRAAMVQFSEQVRNAAWDTDFSSDVEQAFVRHVEPAVLDIEEATAANSYLGELTRKVVSRPFVVPSGSFLALAISQLSSLPDIVSQAFGISAGSLLIAHDTFREWRERTKVVQQNQMYFYYDAGRRLLKSEAREALAG